MQQGQVFELKKRAVDGSPVWAYRYRTDGAGSRRLQRGGFSSERDAAEALKRALEHLRRQKGVGSTLTLKELVEEYLAQYDAEPEAIDFPSHRGGYFDLHNFRNRYWKPAQIALG